MKALVRDDRGGVRGLQWLNYSPSPPSSPEYIHKDISHNYTLILISKGTNFLFKYTLNQKNILHRNILWKGQTFKCQLISIIIQAHSSLEVQDFTPRNITIKSNTL